MQSSRECLRRGLQGQKQEIKMQRAHEQMTSAEYQTKMSMNTDRSKDLVARSTEYRSGMNFKDNLETGVQQIAPSS